MERIGVIGVGLMGHGIALNIVTKGWPLGYLSHPGNQPSDDLLEAGAQAFGDVAALASDCDILLLCVTGTPQVEDVLTGSGNLLEALRPGMVVVDCSTAIPESTLALAGLVEARGAHFVDAAMTRTPKEAAEGRLNLLIGGAPEIVTRITPMLEAFSENRFYAGPVSSGHRLKLLHNFVSLGSVTLIAEAAACARAAGISDAVLVDCLKRGGGYGAGLDRMAPFLLEGAVDQLRFTVSNSLKDLTYYNAMAEEVGTPHLIAEATREIMARLVAEGHGEEMLPRQVDLMADKGK